MKATSRFIEATKALAPLRAWIGVDETRIKLTNDIRSRAHEIYQHIREDAVLEPHHIAFIQALRSRLQDYCLRDFDVTKEWLAAFDEAFNMC